MESARASRRLFEDVKFQLAGFDAAEKFKFDDLLRDNGAEEAPFEECTHIIVSKLQYDDPVCAAARREDKALVTKAWVTVCIDADAVLDTSSVLYLPVRDPTGIPGCKSFCICLTGYQGQARREIVEMVEMMGSKFTKQLHVQSVTHLICYKFEGPKYEAARRSKIILVNHRWLEDCLRRWCHIDESKYTTMSGYEIEELESQLNNSQNAEPAARTPEIDAEPQITKPSTKQSKDRLGPSPGNVNRRSSISDHAVGNKNVAGEPLKQVAVNKNVAGEPIKQAAVNKNVAREPIQQAALNGATPRRHSRGTSAVDCVSEEVEARQRTSQPVVLTPKGIVLAATDAGLQTKKQVATAGISKSVGVGIDARLSVVNLEKNHVSELQENQLVAAETNAGIGREKGCCHEPAGQQEVAEVSRRAQSSVGAMEDNGCFMKNALTDADSVSGTGRKNKLATSCTPKDPEKASSQTISSPSKKRKGSVGGCEEEQTRATLSKKAKAKDNIMPPAEGEATPVQKSKTGETVEVSASNEADPMDGKESATKTAANKAALVVVELSDDSGDDKGKRKAKCGSRSKPKRRQATLTEEPKPDPKSKRKGKPDVRKRAKSEPKRWFAVGGHKKEKERYHRIIQKLGGNVCKESHSWKDQTSHGVMPLRRTEKVFAAAAAGRWILKPEYLEASEKAGFFVEEEEYEWNGPGGNVANNIELDAPRKWRKSKEVTGCGAFQGMRAVVYGECTLPPLDTLKRVVKAGGGCILAAHPPYHCYLAQGIDYAICGSGVPESDPWIVQFRKHKVACVSEEYMVDFVCKPSFSLEKHILYGTVEAEVAARVRLEKIKEEMKAKNKKLEENEEEDEEEDYACSVCKRRDCEDLMLLCGDGDKRGCNIPVHTFCCDPPMDKVPEGDWYCSKCSKVVGC